MVLLLFSLGNCTKPEDIGLSTLPAEDLLYTDYSDSATILTTTVREDTLRADELSRILIGSIRSTDLGLTDAEYYGQVLLSSTPNLIADSSVGSWGADSLVLALAYISAYGDTAVPQNIHVYRLTEDMSVDSSYYSNRTFTEEPIDLEYYGTPYEIRPTKPVTIGTDTNQTPQLRIRLKDELRDSIFAMNSQTEFANNDNWKSYFKGLHIKLDPVSANGGGILYFSPTNAATKMTLYYHEGTESKSYSFTLSGGARVNHTSHDYTNSNAGTQLANPTVQYDVNYLQPLAGLKTQLSFPFLKHFTASGSILINKAELVITVVSDTLAPDNLLLLARNSSDKFEFPIDYYERSYGGGYSPTAKTYTFGITRTIQRILTGTITDYGYTLNILGSMIAGNSAAIGSGEAPNSQMKLKLYYTKLH